MLQSVIRSSVTVAQPKPQATAKPIGTNHTSRHHLVISKNVDIISKNYIKCVFVS